MFHLRTSIRFLPLPPRSDAHEETLLESILSLDARLQKFAEQKAEAEVWWHKWRKQQDSPSLVTGAASSGRASSPPIGATGDGAGRNTTTFQITGSSNTCSSSPTITELALFSMKGMRAMIEQEKEIDKSQVCADLCCTVLQFDANCSAISRQCKIPTFCSDTHD